MDTTQLKQMIANNEDYSQICTFEIVDITEFFRDKNVNYDITQFNQPISSWNLSKVNYYGNIFTNSKTSGVYKLLKFK